MMKTYPKREGRRLFPRGSALNRTGDHRFARRSSATTLSRPFLVASESGVRPKLSGLSRLTSPHSSSTFTTPSCPLIPAHASDVGPEESPHNIPSQSKQLQLPPLGTPERALSHPSSDIW